MKLTDYISNFIASISDSVFVGQGGNIIHVLDSLGKRKDVKVIPSQNEQAAAIAADAYSRFNEKKNRSHRNHKWAWNVKFNARYSVFVF